MPKHLGREAMAGLDLEWGWNWAWDWAWDWAWGSGRGWTRVRVRDRGWDLVMGREWASDPYWVRLPEEKRDA